MGDWGLGTFLTFLLIFIIVLLVIFYNASKIWSSIDNPTTDNNKDDTKIASYSNLETTAENGTKNYVKKYYPNLSEGDRFVIKISSLVANKNIEPLKDITDSSIICSGYVTVYNLGEVTYEAFIKCGENYTTAEYQERNAK